MLSWYMITQNELFIKYGNFTQHELSYEFVNACKYGDLTSVKYLLTSPELKKHADIHAEYDDGFKTSAMNGKVDIVKHLLTNIGENDPKNLNMQKNSGFLWACENGHLDVVEYLLTFSLEQYIDFQKTEYNLDWAMENGHQNVLKGMILSLYKNDILTYLENKSKIEKYYQDNGLDIQEVLKDEINDIKNRQAIMLGITL